jgi:hypothetical protein
MTTTVPSAVSGATVDPGITLSCPAGGPSCQADLTATVMVGAPDTPSVSRGHALHAVTVSSTSFTIPTGTTEQPTFTLNRLGQMLLADHKRLPIQVSVAGQAQGQATITATKPLMLDGRKATYTVSAIKMQRNGTVTLRVRVSDAGLVEVMLSAWKDDLATAARVLSPAPGRFVYARASKTANGSGTLSFQIKPTPQGRKLLEHHTFPVTLRPWVSYIPLYSFQTDTGYYDVRPGGNSTGCHNTACP